MSKEYKRFTKEDWYGYAGCEKFHDGSDPFIYEKELESDGSIKIFVTVIVSQEAIDIEIGRMNMETKTDLTMAWVKQNPEDFNSMKAEGYMRKIVEAISKFPNGSDLCYELDNPEEKVLKGFEYCGEF